MLLSALSPSDQKRKCMRTCSGGPETAHMPLTIMIRKAGAGTCGEARTVSPPWRLLVNALGTKLDTVGERRSLSELSRRTDN